MVEVVRDIHGLNALKISDRAAKTKTNCRRGVVWDQSINNFIDGRIESNHMPPKLTNEIITAAIVGFEAQKRQIDVQIAELRGMLDGNRPQPAATSESAPRKRKRFSAAARKRMKEAQQRRWAKVRGGSEPAPQATTSATPKRKRRISKAGMARIVAATKARWARVRAAKAAAAKNVAVKKPKTAKKAAGKKAAPAAA